MTEQVFREAEKARSKIANLEWWLDNKHSECDITTHHPTGRQYYKLSPKMKEHLFEMLQTEVDEARAFLESL